MPKILDLQSETNLFAQLGKDLASTTQADVAAKIILDVADTLIGWDAGYLILYDPQIGGNPRPLLTIDTIEGKKIIQTNEFPKKPSENMLKAIDQGEFLSLYEAHFEIDPSLAFGNKGQRTLSQMFVPVQSVSRTIGVLSVQSYQVNAYETRQLKLLKDLATHCAGALERIWAQEALTDLVERLKILHQATSAINAELDIEKVCEVVYKTVVKVMSCNDFVVDGYNPKTNEIIPIYAIENPNRRVYTEKYFADHGLAGEIVLKKEPILFNSVKEMDESNIRFEFYGSEEDPTESLLAVPMMLHGEIYGMVSAQSYEQDAYDEDDQYLLEVLASHVAIAIENTRLFDSIQQVAYIDALTSTLNRRRFYELAELEFVKYQELKSPLAMIMLDVDDFKKFNDQFGHKVGDLVLTKVAETCKSALRGSDILGRLGGEEFALVLPNTKLTYAVEIASRLCSLTQKIKIPEYDFSISISVGVATCDESCKTLDMLIDHADQAMYVAKNAGRNQVHVWGSDIDNS